MAWYMGAVVCTAMCHSFALYPGLDTFDKCLTELSAFNLGVTGSQIAPKMVKRSDPGFHFRSGCFEVKGVAFKEQIKELTRSKFGPEAFQADPNVKRILRGKMYDHPKSPYEATTRFWEFNK